MNLTQEEYDLLTPEWRAESERRIKAEIAHEEAMDAIARERAALKEHIRDDRFKLKLEPVQEQLTSLKDDIAALTAHVNVVAKLVSDMSGSVLRISEHMAAPKVTVPVRNANGDIESTIIKTIIEPRDE